MARFLKAKLASAQAHPNIAFIKYWGNRNPALRLPLNGSLSMNLGGLATTTTVQFLPDLRADTLKLNGVIQDGASLLRVSEFLDRVRALAGLSQFAQIESTNNFPAGAGIASSASAFAALACASAEAAGLELAEAELSRLARLGSGSACRSIPSGFVEWFVGEDEQSSYAVSIAPPEHWDLCDVVVVLERGHKQTGSSEGHSLAQSSPLNSLRQAGVAERLERCRGAILGRDFEAFAEVIELDSHWMHAVMRSSTPPLHYWNERTELVLWQVLEWRRTGHAVCTTVDAGANVHVLMPSTELAWAKPALQALPGVLELFVCPAGGGAQLLKDA